jgi:hypothetical protein
LLLLTQNVKNAWVTLVALRLLWQKHANSSKMLTGLRVRNFATGAVIAARTVGYSRQANKGAGSGPKWQEQVLQSNVDYLKTTQKPKQGETPEAFDARIRKMASDVTAAQLKTSFSTSENAPGKQAAALAPVQQRVDEGVAQDIADFKLFSPEGARYRSAIKANAPVRSRSVIKGSGKRFPCYTRKNTRTYRYW